MEGASYTVHAFSSIGGSCIARESGGLMGMVLWHVNEGLERDSKAKDP